MTRSDRRQAGNASVPVLIIGIALLGVAIQTLAGWAPTRIAGELSIPWWALLPAFVVAGVAVTHVTIGRQTHTVTLVEIPLVVGLMLASPAALIVARLVGSSVALVAHRRLPARKVAFNLALAYLETSAALAVYHAIAASGSGGARWLAAAAAMTLVQLIGLTAVSLAIRLTTGTIPRQSVSPSFVISSAAAVIGMIGVELASRDLVLVLVPGGLGGLLYISARTLGALRDRVRSLELLVELERTDQLPLAFDHMIQTSLATSREMLQVEEAEVVVERASGELIRYTLDFGGSLTHEPIPNGMAEGARAVVRGTNGEAAASQYLQERGFDNGLIAPLPSDGRATGALVVANRLGPRPRFHAVDVNLLTMLARRLGLPAT